MSDWKEDAFHNFSLYAVTDLTSLDDSIYDKVSAACEGGADIIQLRSKKMCDRELFEVGKKLKQIIESKQKLFFINDRPDLAFALGADGVHVGQDDLPIESIRQMSQKLNQKIWIGKSTHSLVQAKQTVLEKPDYIGVGPIFGTPTKPSYAPVGLHLIKEIAPWIQIPFVAIGGIDQYNIQDVLFAGATRVAVVRAIFSAEDIYESTKRLRKQIEHSNGQPC